MQEFIFESENFSIDECLNSDHYPNKITIKAIKDAKNCKGIVTGKEAEKISKKLGI